MRATRYFSLLTLVSKKQRYFLPPARTIAHRRTKAIGRRRRITHGHSAKPVGDGGSATILDRRRQCRRYRRLVLVVSDSPKYHGLRRGALISPSPVLHSRRRGPRLPAFRMGRCKLRQIQTDQLVAMGHIMSLLRSMCVRILFPSLPDLRSRRVIGRRIGARDA